MSSCGVQKTLALAFKNKMSKAKIILLDEIYNSTVKPLDLLLTKQTQRADDIKASSIRDTLAFLFIISWQQRSYHQFRFYDDFLRPKS